MSEPMIEFHTGWLGVHAEDHDDGTCRCPCFGFVRSLSPDAYEAAHADLVGEAATPPLDVAEALDALRRIRDNLGKVCEEYELCHHIGCEQSYTAWVVADSALRKIDHASS